jgi:hypothetical protein
MDKFAAKISAVLVLFASPAGAGAAPAPQNTPSEVCLQNNRIWSWDALDDRTLVVGDVQNHRYLVKLSGGCIQLSVNPTVALRFITKTNLGCVQRGDMVSYRAPALGRLSCFVDEVQPYAPGSTVSAK